MNIGDAASVEALAREVEEAFGVPHVVVNCAGMPQSGKRVLDQDLAEDAGLWRVNYRGTLPQTISLLELRLSVEVEAAGLCAGRRTDAEGVAIRALMEQVDARHDDPATVQIHYDYGFHLAIARATRNEFIHGFPVYLRPVIVPRFQPGHWWRPNSRMPTTRASTASTRRSWMPSRSGTAAPRGSPCAGISATALNACVPLLWRQAQGRWMRSRRPPHPPCSPT